MAKKTNEQFLSEIKTINNGRYEILEEYKGAVFVLSRFK